MPFVYLIISLLDRFLDPHCSTVGDLKFEHSNSGLFESQISNILVFKWSCDSYTSDHLEMDRLKSRLNTVTIWISNKSNLNIWLFRHIFCLVFKWSFCMSILMKRDMCTRIFLLCQIWGFMCNYKSFSIKDLEDPKLF